MKLQTIKYKLILLIFLKMNFLIKFSFFAKIKAKEDNLLNNLYGVNNISRIPKKFFTKEKRNEDKFLDNLFGIKNLKSDSGTIDFSKNVILFLNLIKRNYKV